jgi:hypothetical protein
MKTDEHVGSGAPTYRSPEERQAKALERIAAALDAMRAEQRAYCVCGHSKSQHDGPKCCVPTCACGPGCIHDGFVDADGPEGNGEPAQRSPIDGDPISTDEDFDAAAKSMAQEPAPSPAAAEVWRVGRKLGRTLYLNEELAGMVDTPELAEAIVAAMNREGAPPPPSPPPPPPPGYPLQIIAYSTDDDPGDLSWDECVPGDKPRVYLRQDLVEARERAMRELWRAAEAVAMLQPAAHAKTAAEAATYQRFYDAIREAGAALSAAAGEKEKNNDDRG